MLVSLRAPCKGLALHASRFMETTGNQISSQAGRCLHKLVHELPAQDLAQIFAIALNIVNTTSAKEPPR